MSDNDDSEGGLTRKQWRMVLRRVSLIRFLLTMLASGLMFAAIGGIYVTTVDNRIEQNVDHLERVDAKLEDHGERLAGIDASQSATETAAARLEERLSAQAETLQRIEGLLERLLSENYRPLPKNRE